VVGASIAIAIASPASANSGNVSGDQGVPSTVYWDTPRTNGYAQNSDFFTLTGGSPGWGDGMTAALRNASGGECAAGKSYGSAVVLRNTNGNYWNPAGTFYLTTKIPASQCGGSGCGVQHWTGILQWNIKYVP